jgi:hypothetical protein
VVEAPDPNGMVPASTPNIFKVIEIIHILWINTGIHHHAITTTHAHKDVGFWFLTKILVHTWSTNDVMMQWLRLQTQM